MRKIVLGVATVLLSLGLLAGCNNEENDKVVSIKVDNTATVVVGESLALPYTVEPEKAKVEVLNDHEEYVTASADAGLLCLDGLAAGSATITLVGTYKKYEEANVNISVSVVSESTTEQGPGPETGGSGSGYYFGFESDDVLYYITGGTLGTYTYEGAVTTDISEAVEVTFEVDTEVENAYYISFEYEEVEHWITIVAGDHTNLSYATEKAPIYLHTDGEAEYFGNESGDYFLCYNATYKCLYASKVSDYITSSPVAGIYTASGELVAGGVGGTPEPLPVIDPDDLTEGDTGKLGLYQGGKGAYYYFTGEINSNGFGVLSTNWDAGVSVTELSYEEYVVLRIGEEGSYQYIGAKDVAASGVALYDEPYALTYDETYDAFLTAYGERFIGTYGTYETLSWSDASKYLGEEGQYAAQLYKEEQKLPAPASENIKISGPTSVYVDSTITLTATVDAGYDQSIVWSTEDTTYATVDASTGVVTGVAAGTATIKATSGVSEEAYAEYTVEVVALPTGTSLLGSFDFSSIASSETNAFTDLSTLDTYWTGNTSLYLGLRQTSSVYLGGGGSYAPSDRTDCIKFGTSSLTGYLEFKFALGTNVTQVVLTAAGWGGSSSVSAANLIVNGDTQAVATSTTPGELTYDITGNWTNLIMMEASARLEIFSISVFGTYTTEFDEITSLTLTADPVELNAGETTEVSVTWEPDTAFDIDTLEWASDEPSVANVTRNLDGAEIHAYGAGTAAITATATNGVSGSISISVVDELQDSEVLLVSSLGGSGKNVETTTIEGHQTTVVVDQNKYNADSNPSGDGNSSNAPYIGATEIRLYYNQTITFIPTYEEQGATISSIVITYTGSYTSSSKTYQGHGSTDATLTDSSGETAGTVSINETDKTVTLTPSKTGTVIYKNVKDSDNTQLRFSQITIYYTLTTN